MATRRDILVRGGAAAVGASLAAPALAQTTARAEARHAVSKLPARGPVLVRGGYVLTMDGADQPGADVHIENGQIKAVGHNLSAPGATLIEARDCIVMPGLVETHWHMWTALLRSMGGTPGRGYWPMTTAIAGIMTPADMHMGALIASAEAINGGITTLHDWCHNIVSYEHAEADLRAVMSTGVRGRFSWGSSRNMPPLQPIDVAAMKRMKDNWASYSNEGLLSMGMAWRGWRAAGKTLPDSVWRVEYDAARAADLPISIHANGDRDDQGNVAGMAERKLLYPGMQIIHGVNITPAEVEAMAQTNCVMSCAPIAAMHMGMGLPHVQDYQKAGIKTGISVDSVPFVGSVDMFQLMKLIELAENAAAHNEFGMSPRRLIEMATIEGAQTLGLADKIGSLTPGKRADVIVIDTRRINTSPFTEPDHMIVDAVQPANVDTVIIDGRILKRNGRLTAIDAALLSAEADRANLDVRRRGKWS